MEPAESGERRIAGYLVLGQLGEGGMGEVFLAEDEKLRRKVALKSIRSEFRLDRELRARFLREARVLSQLDHPGICRVFNYVNDPDGDYIVLELIEGHDLRQAIAAGIDPRRAMEIAIQICDALTAAHAAGVVHRDLKPANVMLARDGSAKVLDFGLSRARGAADEGDAPPAESAATAAFTPRPPRVGQQGTLIWSFPSPSEPSSRPSTRVDESLRTVAGGVMGTPRYMSPEQARGESVTAASDMFALGLLLQELFTGEQAYERGLTPPEVMERSRRGSTRPVRGIDRDLAQLIQSLESPSPGRRPTAVETLRRLRWIQRKPQRRWRRASAAALLLAALGGAVKYTLDLRRERGRAQGRTEAALRMMETLLQEQVPVLAEVGRLDAFDAAAEGVRAYFTRIADEELTDREQVQLVRLLMQIGDVRSKQGRQAESVVEFERALALAQQLAERLPRDTEVLLALGAAHYYIGRCALIDRGDAAAALQSFRAYRDAAERSAPRDPDRGRAMRELIYARNAIAGALLEQGKAREALDEQTEVVRLSRELSAERPEDSGALLDLADNLSWLASAQRGAGRNEAAQGSLEEELLLRRALLAADPRNAVSRTRLSFCLTFLAQLRLLGERAGDALEAAREARDLLAPLSAQDPQNAELRGNLSVAETVLAEVEAKAAR